MLGLLQTMHPGEARIDEVAAQQHSRNLVDCSALEHPDTILRVLNQLHFSRNPVALHLENEQGHHCLHSRIAMVQREQRSIVLQRTTPVDWRSLVAPGTEVEVNCYLPSGQLAFVSQLWPLEGSERPGQSAQYCRLQLPDRIMRFQLRKAFRVSLPPGSSRARLQLADEAGSLVFCCEARVLDLSLAGCSLLLPPELPVPLPVGSSLSSVQFDLLNGSLHFENDLQLCRRAPAPGGQSLAGLQFLPLDPAVQRRLQQLLATLQRDQLRHQLQMI